MNVFRSTALTSYSGEDLSTLDEALSHFASKTCTSCNDDGKAIFTLEALNREIDYLKDYKAIDVDKASPIILN